MTVCAPLPYRLLLRQFLDGGPTGPSRRAMAIVAARGDWLTADFLNNADEPTLRGRLLAFYEAIVDPPLHCDTLARKTRLVRHGLNHILHGTDPLPTKLERCVRPAGAYRVPGLGRTFWAAIAQATDSDRLPGWTLTTERGLARIGLLKQSSRDGPDIVFGKMIDGYATLLAFDSRLTALHVDDFLGRVAATRGRELAAEPCSPSETIADVVRRVRSKFPLRERLKDHLPTHQAEHDALAAALKAADVDAVRKAIGAGADAIHDDALLTWVGRLWTDADPHAAIADYWHTASLLGGGSPLPAAVLHRRDARAFPPWDDAARRGLASLDDGYDPAGPPAENYRLFAEGCDELRRRFRLHPVEVPDVLTIAARDADEPRPAAPFAGFCTDTFRFLADLERNNAVGWMADHRERYAFAVREPLAELCRALVERYVAPVLNGQHGWDLETAAMVGRALTSIRKNDRGRTVPYETALWITFYRRVQGGKRDDVQLFVRLDARGVACGLRLGRRARDAGRLFRKNVQLYADGLFRALATTDALKQCRFLGDDGTTIPIEGPADLRKWAAGKTLVAERLTPAEDPAVRSDDLVGEILLTFDRLLPAYHCAVEDAPAFGPPPGPAYDSDRFRAATYLSESWLRTATSLLAMKRQIILQGVPGTGKTHVARCLARLLTGGRDDRMRLVQFHPAFSYEEFVEGIKARTVEANGRHEVTYPVEDGVLCQFAAAAAARPAEPFVLLIDEINRGNLPRIFGELLYLLEYRDQEVVLPYSRRAFRLPPNLFVIATMNAADRSVAHVDHALRRRFSFLDMPPDARVLASWLEAHPPADEPFGPKVVALFETLNRKLADDLGSGFQVGHSYFMVPSLDPGQLRVVWDHHVRPLLNEYFAAYPKRLTAYDLDALMGVEPMNRSRARSSAE